MLFEKVAKRKKPAVDPGMLGVRSKLGGKPDWEQGAEFPSCPDCLKRMTFIAQIDSMEHNEDHNPNRVDWRSAEQHYLFGDVGMIYVFMCCDCLETKSVFQCG